MKKIFGALLTLALLALLCAPAPAESPEDYLGKPMPDFTVQTIDGGTFTLSEALRDHDMVLINLWATWCGYCTKEFPFVEEAYERYSDRVAVIALSVEPKDTPEVIREYAQANGLTFPMASDGEANLAALFVRGGIPVTAVVDRFGNVALVEAGAKDATAKFTALFDYFLDEAYTQTTVLEQFPAPKPVAGETEAVLSVAANAEGGALTFRNSADAQAWPMLSVEDGGRTVLGASNRGVDESNAAVYTTVTAAEGDALAFEFKTSTESAYDAMYVAIDGQVVKYFSGEHDWTQWALPLAAGDHEVGFGYWKDEYQGAGEDCAWLDNVRVASGAEAAELLSAMPARPAGEAFDVSAPQGARRVALDDPEGRLAYSVGVAEGWMVDGDFAALEVSLRVQDDPEMALVHALDDDFNLGGALKADGSGYQAVVSLADRGFNLVRVQPGTSAENEALARTYLLFDGEEGADSFVEFISMYGVETAWSYAD